MPEVAPNSTACFTFHHSNLNRTNSEWWKCVLKNGEFYESSNIQVSFIPEGIGYKVSFDVDDEEGAQYAVSVALFTSPDTVNFNETFTARSDSIQGELDALRSQMQLLLNSVNSSDD